jgi:hypothetical protein
VTESRSAGFSQRRYSQPERHESVPIEFRVPRASARGGKVKRRGTSLHQSNGSAGAGFQPAHGFPSNFVCRGLQPAAVQSTGEARVCTNRTGAQVRVFNPHMVFRRISCAAGFSPRRYSQPERHEFAPIERERRCGFSTRTWFPVEFRVPRASARGGTVNRRGTSLYQSNGSAGASFSTRTGGLKAAAHAFSGEVRSSKEARISTKQTAAVAGRPAFLPSTPDSPVDVIDKLTPLK